MTVGRIPSVEGGIQPTLLTAKGDLISATAASTVARLAVGSNDQILVADSTASTGLKWATPASSNANFSLLGSASLSGATTTVSGISGINQIYVLVNNASTTAGGDLINLRINTDTGANYDVFRGEVIGATSWAATNVSGNANLAQTRIIIGFTSNSGTGGFCGGSLIQGCNTAGNKMVAYSHGSDSGGGNGQYVIVGYGRYTGTSTVSSVSLNSGSGTFDAGTMYVYGSA